MAVREVLETYQLNQLFRVLRQNGKPQIYARTPDGAEPLTNVPSNVKPNSEVKAKQTEKKGIGLPGGDFLTSDEKEDELQALRYLNYTDASKMVITKGLPEEESSPFTAMDLDIDLRKSCNESKSASEEDESQSSASSDSSPDVESSSSDSESSSHPSLADFQTPKKGW